MHNTLENKGFSLVEIIVVISILVLLAFIGLNTQNIWNEKTNNSKTVSDLSTVNNALVSYLKTKNDLPMPGGNNYIYDENGMYNHDWNDEKTHGVSGFITENTLPKSFMNFLPVDNKTKQYYAYAKRKTKQNYQVAGIIWKNGEPEANVLGNLIEDQGMIDLIKEYNGPNFVYDKSKQSFPFSTDERDFTARISNFTGVVIINNNDLGLTGTLDYILREGNTISTNTGSYATIYFSDGSRSILGNDNETSTLTLSMMKYEGENNLITKIKLALGGGTVWNDVTKLNSEGSDFQIYTTDVAAAVRGTVFGVRKDTVLNNSNVTVKSGKVDLFKNIKTIDTKIIKDTILPETSSDFVEVKNGETASGSNIFGETITSSTGALQDINEDYIESEDVYLSDNIYTRVISWEYSKEEGEGDEEFEIVLELNPIFRKADILKIKGSDGVEIKIDNDWEDKLELKLDNSITQLTGLISQNKKIYVSFCRDTKKSELLCSREAEINLGIPDFKQEDNDRADLETSEKKCSKGFDFIDSYGCVENNLYESGSEDNNWKVVGFAPYDKAGDLGMYKYGGKLEPESHSGILDNGFEFGRKCKLSDKKNSLCEDEDGNKGIFMNIGIVAGTKDFLKYNFEDFNPGNGDFAIEINAKIKDYSSQAKYLLDNDILKINVNELGIILVKSKKILKVNGEKFRNIIIPIENKKITKVIIDGITYIKDIDGVMLNIDNIDLDKNKTYTIGSTLSYFGQLNNTLNYLKVYKRFR